MAAHVRMASGTSKTQAQDKQNQFVTKANQSFPVSKIHAGRTIGIYDGVVAAVQSA